MTKVIIVHGWSGDPTDCWIPWLKNELEQKGCEVITPTMPDTDYPIIEKWVNKLSEVVGEPNINTFLVGGSIGCQTILRYLETISTPVGGAVFVAGWFDLENLELPEEIEIAKSWIETPIDLVRVKSVLPEATLIISDNDPFGCLEENRIKFSQIVTKEIVVHNAGHFETKDGFAKLPKALSELLKMTKLSNEI